MYSCRRILAVLSILCLLAGIAGLQAQWIENGVPVCSAPGSQAQCDIAGDGAGGAILAWQDVLGSDGDIYAQRIDEHGYAQWMMNGVAVCTAPYSQSRCRIATDGGGGAIIVWRRNRPGYGSTSNDIYVQRIDPNGNLLWTSSGVPICTAYESQRAPRIMSDGAGGAFITWIDRRLTGFEGPYDIFAQRVDQDGTILWTVNGIPICTATQTQMGPEFASDGSSGAIITWHDARSGNKDIYVQRITGGGSTAWMPNGIAVCTAPGDQDYPQIAAHGIGEAIITWQDDRNGHEDIYAQRIDNGGTPMWAANGIAVCSSPNDQSYPMIIPDGSGCVIITWEDNRSGNYDIYVQRIDGSGNPLWMPGGVPVCTQSGDQSYPRLVTDDSGGVIITWRDWRNGNDDIYAQRLDASGNDLWTPDGVAVETGAGGAGSYHRLRITPDASGGAIIAWDDDRSGDLDIFAQRITAAGEMPVATMLRAWDASVEGRRVMIAWTLNQIGIDARFSVYRLAVPDGEPELMPMHTISSDGLSFSCIDETCEPGTQCRYIVGVMDEVGSRVLFETDLLSIPPAALSLYQNYPNPFNPVTSIEYYVPESTVVEVSIYDLTGRRVSVLVSRYEERGRHTVTWNGENEYGLRVNSGTYFCRLKAGKNETSMKIVLFR